MFYVAQEYSLGYIAPLYLFTYHCGLCTTIYNAKGNRLYLDDNTL